MATCSWTTFRTTRLHGQTGRPLPGGCETRVRRQASQPGPGSIPVLRFHYSPKRQVPCPGVCDAQATALHDQLDHPPFIASRPDLRRCQVALSATEYEFLDDDSFINCAEITDYFDNAAITGEILADVGRLRGNLSQAKRGQVIEAVQDAKTVSRRHKALITDALG